MLFAHLLSSGHRLLSLDCLFVIDLGIGRAVFISGGLCIGRAVFISGGLCIGRAVFISGGLCIGRAVFISGGLCIGRAVFISGGLCISSFKQARHLIYNMWDTII